MRNAKIGGHQQRQAGPSGDGGGRPPTEQDWRWCSIHLFCNIFDNPRVLEQMFPNYARAQAAAEGEGAAEQELEGTKKDHDFAKLQSVSDLFIEEDEDASRKKAAAEAAAAKAAAETAAAKAAAETGVEAKAAAERAENFLPEASTENSISKKIGFGPATTTTDPDPDHVTQTPDPGHYSPAAAPEVVSTTQMNLTPPMGGSPVPVEASSTIDPMVLAVMQQVPNANEEVVVSTLEHPVFGTTWDGSVPTDVSHLGDDYDTVRPGASLGRTDYDSTVRPGASLGRTAREVPLLEVGDETDAGDFLSSVILAHETAEGEDGDTFSRALEMSDAQRFGTPLGVGLAGEQFFGQGARPEQSDAQRFGTPLGVGGEPFFEGVVAGGGFRQEELASSGGPLASGGADAALGPPVEDAAVSSPEEGATDLDVVAGGEEGGAGEEQDHGAGAAGRVVEELVEMADGATKEGEQFSAKFSSSSADGEDALRPISKKVTQSGSPSRVVAPDGGAAPVVEGTHNTPMEEAEEKEVVDHVVEKKTTTLPSAMKKKAASPEPPAPASGNGAASSPGTNATTTSTSALTTEGTTSVLQFPPAILFRLSTKVAATLPRGRGPRPAPQQSREQKAAPSSSSSSAVTRTKTEKRIRPSAAPPTTSTTRIAPTLLDEHDGEAVTVKPTAPSSSKDAFADLGVLMP